MLFAGTSSIPIINRQRLIRALRDGPHPCWNFANVRHCALPIARGIDSKFRLGLGIRDQMRIFGVWMPYVGYSRFYGCWGWKVTPTMVADALDAAPYR